MRLADYDYELPEELIAQAPLPQRSASRLLIVGSGPGGLVDASIADLPQHLDAGDLMIFNDTRVIPARLWARKPSGGRVELLLERAEQGVVAYVQSRSSKGLRPGMSLLCAGATVQVIGREGEFWRIECPAPALDFFARFGEVPLPPYITRRPDANDRERYQSTFARVPGAVAAPTASLHFDPGMLAALQLRGVEHAFITLHVGAGTFQPIRVDDPGQHRMHAERVAVPAATISAIERTRAQGRRVIAVGTTVVRALETSAAGGTPRAFVGETDIFIHDDYEWRCVDALVTNFHLPRSTLLMLVSAFSGRETVLAAYRHAVAQRYRFFSYGDAMLLTRPRRAAP